MGASSTKMALPHTKATAWQIGSVFPMYGPMSQFILEAVKGTTDRRGPMAIVTANETRIAPQEGVLDRLNARFRSRRLDEALTRGVAPESAAPLALRARRLTALSGRRATADSLRRVIRGTCQGVPPSRARISPALCQVIAALDDLTRLADALASPGPVAARGVAQAWLLLIDGTGPLYNANSTANLSARAASAANNLRLVD
jgi:hypothetical protein